MKNIARPVLLTFTIAWYLSIWVASSLPSDSLPSYEIFSMDKLLHFGVYFVLGFLVMKSARQMSLKRSKVHYLYVFLFVSSIADEWHQHFIPGRSVSIWDFVANATGLLVSIMVYVKYYDKSR
jgi:VanZ family protein